MTADGKPLRRPNDRWVGPDGALYFTDPGDYDPAGELSGCICRYPNGQIEMLDELGNAYPNGIGFGAAGRLIWAETHTKRVVASDEGGAKMVA